MAAAAKINKELIVDITAAKGPAKNTPAQTGGNSCNTIIGITESEVSGTPLKPIEEYSASISLRCYATNDRLLYSNAKTGSPTLSLSYSSGTSITKVRTVHTFNGTTFGDFTVFA